MIESTPRTMIAPVMSSKLCRQPMCPAAMLRIGRTLRPEARRIQKGVKWRLRHSPAYVSEGTPLEGCGANRRASGRKMTEELRDERLYIAYVRHARSAFNRGNVKA